NPKQAWRAAVELMERFRQGPEFGRNSGQQPNRPGRSRWPEPDTIRDAVGRVDEHQANHPARPYYPRADLGLPIVFQFKVAAGRPAQFMLQGAEKTLARMAS